MLVARGWLVYQVSLQCPEPESEDHQVRELWLLLWQVPLHLLVLAV